MISQRDGGDGMKTTNAHLTKEVDRMAITRVKNGNGFIFRQALTIGNYAWI